MNNAADKLHFYMWVNDDGPREWENTKQPFAPFYEFAKSAVELNQDYVEDHGQSISDDQMVGLVTMCVASGLLVYSLAFEGTCDMITSEDPDKPDRLKLRITHDEYGVLFDTEVELIHKWHNGQEGVVPIKMPDYDVDIVEQTHPAVNTEDLWQAFEDMPKPLFRTVDGGIRFLVDKVSSMVMRNSEEL